MDAYVSCGIGWPLPPFAVAAFACTQDAHAKPTDPDPTALLAGGWSNPFISHYYPLSLLFPPQTFPMQHNNRYMQYHRCCPSPTPSLLLLVLLLMLLLLLRRGGRGGGLPWGRLDDVGALDLDVLVVLQELVAQRLFV